MDPTLSVNEIIHQYEQFVTLYSQNISTSLEDPTSIINKSRDNLRQQLIAFNHMASTEEKLELFRYFIKIYLQIGENPDSDLHISNPTYVPISGNQTTLAGEKQTGMWSGIVPSSSMTTPNDIQVNKELLIDRIFFVLNYYSREYVPTFLDKTLELLQKYSFTQKTLHNFTGETIPKLYLSPMTTRIAHYIQKTGSSFLSGLPHFEQKHSKFADSMKNVSLKQMLKEFLLSPQGIRLFPEWFTVLNPITQDSVVNNLLLKIP